MHRDVHACRVSWFHSSGTKVRRQVCSLSRGMAGPRPAGAWLINELLHGWFSMKS